jgi:integrase
MEKALTMGVFARGKKLWVRFKGPDEKWTNRTTGYNVGQEALAHEVLAEIDKLRLAATGPGPATSASPAGLTVRAFATGWIPRRRAAGFDWKNDESRLKNHVLPLIGDMLLSDVRRKHLAQMVATLRGDRDRDLAPRTVHAVYSLTAAMFRDAEKDELIEHDPCRLDASELGPCNDRDPEWRNQALFTRDEAQALISDPRIPPDRQMAYAFPLLAGMRPGEASALRWRHYDPTVTPLGKLTIARSYNTRNAVEKSTKDDVVRVIPVHPTLAAMLAEWKLGGWAAMMGRAPGPDDLIIPLPPVAAERRRRRERDSEAFRSTTYTGKCWSKIDIPTLGFRYREPYACKSTFITLALDDGANPEIIEHRVTHTKKTRSAFGGYYRGTHWAETCAEVAKLRISRAGPREIVVPQEPAETVVPREPASPAPPARVRTLEEFNEEVLGLPRRDKCPHGATWGRCRSC